MKASDIAAAPLLALFVLAMIAVPGATCYGTYHGFDKHGSGTGMLAFIPLYAWYLSYESISHPSDVERIEDISDFELSIILLSKEGTLAPKDFPAFLQEFSGRMAALRYEDRQHLMRWSRLYVRYTESFVEDFSSYIREIRENPNGFNAEYSSSDETNSLLEKLVSDFPMQDWMFSLREEGARRLNRSFETSVPISRQKSAVLLEVFAAIEQSMRSSLHEMKAVYSMMYGESFSES